MNSAFKRGGVESIHLYVGTEGDATAHTSNYSLLVHYVCPSCPAGRNVDGAWGNSNYAAKPVPSCPVPPHPFKVGHVVRFSEYFCRRKWFVANPIVISGFRHAADPLGNARFCWL